MHSPTSTDQVRDMFNRISPTYDLLNTLLSLGVHNVWAKRAVNALPKCPDGVCLDLCTGTGALVPLLAPRYRTIVAADLSPRMLAIGQTNLAKISNCEWVEANALALPFENDQFNAITVAYGVRNWPDTTQGLKEMLRVVKPGGVVSILEFGQPSNAIWRYLFSLYSRWIIPSLGKLISGDSSAYQYLPETSARFPCGDTFERLLASIGWHPKQTVSFMGGIAFNYTAEKPLGQCLE